MAGYLNEVKCGMVFEMEYWMEDRMVWMMGYLMGYLMGYWMVFLTVHVKMFDMGLLFVYTKYYQYQ